MTHTQCFLKMGQLLYYYQTLLLLRLLRIAFAVQSQSEVPYSKHLNFSKNEFKENRFKYDDDTNTWTLSKKEKGTGYR